MEVGDPQSFDRYSYVQGDPVNFIDPAGLSPGDPAWMNHAPTSLFDDYFINSWKNGWGMLYGLNPITITFESSHGWLNDGHWTEYTTIWLGQDAKQVEKEMWERWRQVDEENERNRKKAIKAYGDCIKPFEDALVKELARLDKKYNDRRKFATAVGAIGGAILSGPLGMAVGAVSGASLIEYEKSQEKEEAEDKEMEARDAACGRDYKDPRYGYKPKELPPLYCPNCIGPH